MKRISILIVPFILLLSVTIVFSKTNPKELMAIYNNFKKAAATGKESEISKYMSKRFLNTYKNTLSSMGMKLTPDMVKNFENHYDISKAKLEKTIENGPTVGLVLNNPTDEKTGKHELLEFIVLRFIKEEKSWKYDQGFSTSIIKHDKNGKLAVFSDTLIPEKMAINGKIPDVPELIPMAEVNANYFIFGNGYKVELSVNGNKPVVSTGGSSSGMLTGGLKKGKNFLELKITKLEDQADMYPSVRIDYLDKDKNKKNAFDLNVDEKKVGVIKEEFTVK